MYASRATGEAAVVEIEPDHLVIGAGASGMALTDALIADADVDVVLVDRRHSPGGHWNDAYPIGRLHQPSATYGVNSRPLGTETIDAAGPNALSGLRSARPTNEPRCGTALGAASEPGEGAARLAGRLSRNSR